MNTLFNFLIMIDGSEINTEFFLEDPQGNEALPSLKVKSRNNFFKENLDIDEPLLSLEDSKRMLLNKTFHQWKTDHNSSTQRVFLLYFYFQNLLFVNLVETDVRLK